MMLVDMAKTCRASQSQFVYCLWLRKSVFFPHMRRIKNRNVCDAQCIL